MSTTDRALTAFLFVVLFMGAAGTFLYFWHGAYDYVAKRIKRWAR